MPPCPVVIYVGKTHSTTIKKIIEKYIRGYKFITKKNSKKMKMWKIKFTINLKLTIFLNRILFFLQLILRQRKDVLVRELVCEFVKEPKMKILGHIPNIPKNYKFHFSKMVEIGCLIKYKALIINWSPFFWRNRIN